MAVKIRLKRMGSKKKPFYRIVVADSRSPRDGRFIETVGTYNPLKNPAEVVLKEEDVLNWLQKGAQPSDTVRNILSKEGIKTNVTLIFSANQALLAARAGATFVSPFVGRIDDMSMDGITLIEDIAEIFIMHDIKAEIIAASVRTPMHMTQCAKAGAHIATVPYKVLTASMKHPLTDAGLARFLADWEAANK